ncbi:unnamed protein product [Effrenium voratum]|uniref:MobA-like NTP transferase domain-containing protein n=1 Tax=Effrenium voratum TaxID=2562239 RepID=A0AA36I483_9DINO|nr:unnamed protein product [Effrenium voratum]
MAGTSAPGPQLPRPTKGITKAIISAASRPTALDSRHRPKPLIDIEGTTLISHVLRQLYRGGITHIVFVVSHNGAAIIEELERCRGNLRNLELEVVDLGKDYAGFYAVSLLKAWECCATDLVLIATADHIFDESLVADICRVPLCPRELCVLVDFSRETWTGLPATTVGVQCSEDLHKVCELSRALGEPMVKGVPRLPCVGVEAGLFACTSSIFERLSTLAKSGEYFTITDAIQELASEGLVSSMPTRGRNWLAIETITELQESRSRLQGRADTPGHTPSLEDPLPAIFLAEGPMST